jgi:outer membrane protein
MKKLSIIISFLLLSTTAAFSQKYAFIDTEYILGNIPSYNAAEEKIEKLSEEWEQEIEQIMDQVEKMYKEYQSEKALLTEEMRKKREDAIIQKEKEAKELQKKYFGPEGELFQKREELIKPIQDQVYEAVEELSTEGNYAIIFDTAAGPTIIYFNPKYDKSDEILTKLGYK